MNVTTSCLLELLRMASFLGKCFCCAIPFLESDIMAVWTRLEREPRKPTPFFRIASEPTLKMEEQIRQIRGHIKSQIPDTINDFLETVGTTTIRILGDTRHWRLAEFHTPICVNGREFGSCKPAERWNLFPRREHIPTEALLFVLLFVLDVNNVDYIYETAHNGMTTIPVYDLRLSKSRISNSQRRNARG